MKKRIKNWFKNIIREILKTILKEEYFISGDIGIKETEIIIVKYSYKRGRIEIISDNTLHETPLKDVEKRIRQLAVDYPLTCMKYDSNLRY